MPSRASDSHDDFAPSNPRPRSSHSFQGTTVPRPKALAVPSPTTLLVLTSGAAAFAGLASLALRRTPNRLDVAITTRLQRSLPLPLERGMRWISSAGYAPFTHSLVVSLAANLWVLGRRREAVFSVGTMGAGFTTGVIKLLVRRPRPDQQFRRQHKTFRDNSFPSGHTTHYTVFYGYVFFLVQRLLPESPLRRALMAYCLTLVVLVGPSRIYLGHHWASDVLAGHLVGFTYLVAMLQAYEAIGALTHPTYD
ncbi:MAG TPA: phosphatase PAP2 family protein [Chloroflexota bacterium]|nr:phosphatase PAP2 family protein [Chloroflexota bacterium]